MVPTNLPMNILATLILFLGATVVVVAQGQVDFSNLSTGVNAPISDASGHPIVGPSPYVADLFWSVNTNAPMDSLTPAGDKTPFHAATPYGPGYFFGGILTFPLGYILAQVRVWDTTYGSTYYEARDKGGEFGFSNLTIAMLGASPGNPGSLEGLQSFQLQRLPRLIISPTTTNAILLYWPIEVTTYAVQQSLDVSPTHWITLTNTPAVVGSQNEIILPSPPARMVYRLVSQ